MNPVYDITRLRKVQVCPFFESIIIVGPLVAAIKTSVTDYSIDSITNPSMFIIIFSKYLP